MHINCFILIYCMGLFVNLDMLDLSLTSLIFKKNNRSFWFSFCIWLTHYTFKMAYIQISYNIGLFESENILNKRMWNHRQICIFYNNNLSAESPSHTIKLLHTKQIYHGTNGRVCFDLWSSGIYCWSLMLIFDIKEIVWNMLSSLMDIHQTHIQKLDCENFPT